VILLIFSITFPEMKRREKKKHKKKRVLIVAIPIPTTKEMRFLSFNLWGNKKINREKKIEHLLTAPIRYKKGSLKKRGENQGFSSP